MCMLKDNRKTARKENSVSTSVINDEGVGQIGMPKLAC